ncbi:hypothetical protein AKJ09_02439 [Labilithrix luteola]|uniref:Uncharacterized protein n=2 Tax=Labilithrix luteola TaxID=1391654 RepID=A0A0K1PQF7_9BACT|nr:hypothetical protein AKJ09_02439 [Labilithrix luteola]
MFRPRAMLQAAVGYVRKNPDEVVRAAVNATGLRFGVPLATLRWFAGQINGKKAPKDVEIASVPPALRFAATVDAMGTAVRASAAIKIDEVTIAEDSVRIGVRLRDVKLELAGDSDSPVATLIKSGALDLSKPGNLVKFVPKKPAAIVEAEGDRIVLDLMKMPKLANDPRVRKLLGIVSPVLGIRAIETDRDHLYVKLRATPTGLLEAASKLRDAI